MTSEKLKGKIKSFSEKNNLKAQEVLQMYFFERFLARLEKSKYRANFIIKGGFLISSIIGIQNRTTMDIDTTIKGVPIKEEIIKEIILEILNIVSYEYSISDGIMTSPVVISIFNGFFIFSNFAVKCNL